MSFYLHYNNDIQPLRNSLIYKKRWHYILNVMLFCSVNFYNTRANEKKKIIDIDKGEIIMLMCIYANK